MPDAHAEWSAKLKQLFAEKPRAPKPAPVKTDPGKPAPMAQGAKSIGPVAPVLKKAERAGWYARKAER